MSEEEEQKNKVLIYDDEGVSSLDVLIGSLRATLTNTLKTSLEIVTVSANDIKLDTCFENATLFIVPGGRDLPYVEKIQGEAIRNIQKFVSDGGAYLGLCAGAYFASEFCEFERGTSMEVCGERFLKFFPGKACGCVFPGFQYASEKGSHIVNIKIKEDFLEFFLQVEDNLFPCYYNGGCEFVLDCKEQIESVKMIGKYQDKLDKNAIVLCRVGKGKALLSGVHPEMSYDYVDKSKFCGQEEKLELLKQVSAKQQALFKGLLRILLG